MPARVASVDAWSPWRRAAAFAPHASAYGRALLLFDEVIARSPARPLPRLTASPSTERMSWGMSGQGWLTVPAGEAAVPAVVLELGANPAPPDDPRVVRLTTALGRLAWQCCCQPPRSCRASRCWRLTSNGW